MSTPTPTPSHHAGQALALALEVLRADRQALIDCHSVAGNIPEADELAAQAMAQYDQAIRALEGQQTCRQHALEALRLADAMLRGAHMDARVVETKVRAAIAELSADPVDETAKREPVEDGVVTAMFHMAGGGFMPSLEHAYRRGFRDAERAQGIGQQAGGQEGGAK